MKITNYSSNESIQQELGSRIKSLRISFSITQKEMAERTGISLRTISSLENGKDVSFSTMLEVLRILGRISALDDLIPEENIRPAQIFAYGKPRERASRKKDMVAEKKWKWGDEN